MPSCNCMLAVSSIVSDQHLLLCWSTFAVIVSLVSIAGPKFFPWQNGLLGYLTRPGMYMILFTMNALEMFAVSPHICILGTLPSRWFTLLATCKCVGFQLKIVIPESPGGARSKWVVSRTFLGSLISPSFCSISQVQSSSDCQVKLGIKQLMLDLAFYLLLGAIHTNHFLWLCIFMLEHLEEDLISIAFNFYWVNTYIAKISYKNLCTVIVPKKIYVREQWIGVQWMN